MPIQYKQRLIKLIHIAKSQLGMDDDTYRLMLNNIGKANSTTKMTIAQLEKVLEHLKCCGFKVVATQSRVLASDAQSKKLRALWLCLHSAGEVRSGDEKSLAAFVKRHTKVEALQWLSSHQASMMIERLKKWAIRKEIICEE